MGFTVECKLSHIFDNGAAGMGALPLPVNIKEVAVGNSVDVPTPDHCPPVHNAGRKCREQFQGQL